MPLLVILYHKKKENGIIIYKILKKSQFAINMIEIAWHQYGKK